MNDLLVKFLEELSRPPLLSKTLLLVTGILLLWCVKLWIQNRIFSFLARLLLKGGVIVLFYEMLRHFFRFDG